MRMDKRVFKGTIPISLTVLAFGINFFFRNVLISTLLVSISVGFYIYSLDITKNISHFNNKFLDLLTAIYISQAFFISNVLIKIFLLPFFTISNSSGLFALFEISNLLRILIISIIILICSYAYYLVYRKEVAKFYSKVGNEFHTLSERSNHTNLQSHDEFVNAVGSSVFILAFANMPFMLAVLVIFQVMNILSVIMVFEYNRNSLLTIGGKFLSLLNKINPDEILKTMSRVVGGRKKGVGYLSSASIISLILAFYSNTFNTGSAPLGEYLTYSMIFVAVFLILYYAYQYSNGSKRSIYPLLSSYILLTITLVLSAVYPQTFLLQVIKISGSLTFPTVTKVISIINLIFYEIFGGIEILFSSVAFITASLTENEKTQSAKRVWYWSLPVFMSFTVIIGFVLYPSISEVGLTAISLPYTLTMFALLGLIGWGLLSLGMNWSSSTSESKEKKYRKMNILKRKISYARNMGPKNGKKRT